MKRKLVPILYPVIYGEGIGLERGDPLNGLASISKNIPPCAPMSVISGETCFDTNRKNMCLTLGKYYSRKRGDVAQYKSPQQLNLLNTH